MIQSEMKKCAIIYYSVGGTTKKIAEKIAEGIQDAKMDYKVDLFNLKGDVPEDISEYNLIGIGTPCYFFKPVKPIMDYVNLLKNMEKTFFTFILHGTYVGDAGNKLRQKLKTKGMKEVGYFKAHGWDNFLGYIKKGFLFSPNNPAEEELSAAIEFGKKIACVKDEQDIPLDPKVRNIIYKIEQLLVHPLIIKHWYSREFKVDQEKCTSCAVCVNGCPMQNIQLKDETIPVFGRNCVFCLNCEFSCPEEAIKSSLDKWNFLFSPMINYNISKALQEVEHRVVEHKNGKVKMIELPFKYSNNPNKYYKKVRKYLKKMES
ncbi:MAG: EFR1 family ferrodoxin [Candidatus Heimdallarchaeaceae archaeon]